MYLDKGLTLVGETVVCQVLLELEPCGPCFVEAVDYKLTPHGFFFFFFFGGGKKKKGTQTTITTKCS